MLDLYGRIMYDKHYMPCLKIKNICTGKKMEKYSINEFLFVKESIS